MNFLTPPISVLQQNVGLAINNMKDTSFDVKDSWSLLFLGVMGVCKIQIKKHCNLIRKYKKSLVSKIWCRFYFSCWNSKNCFLVHKMLKHPELVFSFPP